MQNIISEKRKLLPGTQLAQLYGFYEHWLFIDYIRDYFPDLVDELTNSGWEFNVCRFYLPVYQEIIEKHLGKPIWKKLRGHEIANAYGYSTYGYLKSHIKNNKQLLTELQKTGWRENMTALIPLHVDIIVEYLGVPEKVELILNPLHPDYDKILQQNKQP